MVKLIISLSVSWRLCPWRTQECLRWPLTNVSLRPELTLASSRSFKIPFWLFPPNVPAKVTVTLELAHHRVHSVHGGTYVFLMCLCRHSCTRPTCTGSILIAIIFYKDSHTLQMTPENILSSIKLRRKKRAKNQDQAGARSVSDGIDGPNIYYSLWKQTIITYIPPEAM